jgi:integrase
VRAARSTPFSDGDTCGNDAFGAEGRAVGHTFGIAAPKADEEEVEPYSVDEVKRLLETAQTQRNSARWAIALAFGMRQGEVLRLRWPDIDLATCTLTVRRSLLRPKWKHGCSEPCGHKHSGHCPQRVSLRSETGSTKSKAGNRIIGLPDELVRLLGWHHAEQDQERAKAADRK